jgi:isoquinoline 1-oxidoreductase beta subunit
MTGLVIPRRSFLVGLGLSAGTLVLGLPRLARGAGPRAIQLPGGGLTANAFVHVADDGTVTIISHRVEMGQGIRSTLPALIADELGAALDRVRIVQADGDAIYGNQETDGSASVYGNHEAMRRVGAAARTMLIGAAAARWRVPDTACDARDHAVVHAASGRRLGFGELAAAAASQPVPALDHVRLRPWSELRRIGGPLPHVDAPDIVTGRAIYAADVRLPGMRVAVIARPPVPGGVALHHDASGASAVPGVVRIVELPPPTGAPGVQPLGGIAVVAETTWAAIRGRAALRITWRGGPNADQDSAAYRERLLATVRAPAQPVRQVGDAGTALARAARRIVAEYTTPHFAHVTMEPPAAIARVDARGCELWAATQHPQGTREAVARALGLAVARVTVHVTLVGGGFGRKSIADFAVEAALLARATGAPVRVQWTREDDVRHGYYLPATAQRLEVGLDGRGRVIAWLHRTSFTSTEATIDPTKTQAQPWELAEGVTESPLAVPAVRCEYGEAPLPTRVCWLRGVHNTAHAFAINSFVDEIARARGGDPRDVLLELIGPPRVWTAGDLGIARLQDARFPIDAGRMARVIERATELARWRELRAAGRAVGLAAHRTENSYAAWVVALAAEPDGGVRVDAAWGVIDAGRVLNPDRVRAQMEGGFAFGLSLARHGAITLARGAVEQSNFHDHPIARITDVPRALHVDIVASDAPPGGVGEVGVPPVAPAIANALASLSGARLRALPLVPRAAAHQATRSNEPP